MENTMEMMEQAMETVAENMEAPEMTFEAPAVVDTMTDISANVEAVEPSFGLKEGLTLGALLIGGGCVVYTGIDIFKKLKAKHEAKKEEKLAVAKAMMEAEMQANQQPMDIPADDIDVDVEG